MQASPLRVALVQHSFTEDVEASRRLTGTDVLQRAETGVRLVIMPELHNSRYLCQRRRSPATGGINVATKNKK